MAGSEEQPGRVIRSYQPGLRFEVPIYKFGNVYLPRPIPARAAVYALIVWPVMLGIVERLPGVSILLAGFPWPVRIVVLPAAVTLLFALAEVQGRRFHVAVQAWAKNWFSSRQLAGGYRPIARPGGRWRPREIVFISDGRSGVPPSGIRLEGPGRVLLRYPSEAAARGAAMTVRQIASAPCERPNELRIALGASARFSGMKGVGT